MAICNLTDAIETVVTSLRSIYDTEEVPTISTQVFPIGIDGGATSLITPAIIVQFAGALLDLKNFKQYITIDLFFVCNKSPALNDSHKKAVALYDKFCQAIMLKGLTGAVFLSFTGYSFSSIKYEDSIYIGVSTQITLQIKQRR